jgi:hypothetical protein
VPVIADWSDPRIASHDDWRRELAEAAPFAPARGAELLVDAKRGFALRLRHVAALGARQGADEAHVAAQPEAMRVAASKRASLWRLAPAGLPRCAGAVARPRAMTATVAVERNVRARRGAASPSISCILPAFNEGKTPAVAAAG